MYAVCLSHTDGLFIFPLAQFQRPGEVAEAFLDEASQPVSLFFNDWLEDRKDRVILKRAGLGQQLHYRLDRCDGLAAEIRHKTSEATRSAVPRSSLRRPYEALRDRFFLM
jgi:hypothetical protein